MTGLFQIFDRYRGLSRGKSTQKKVAYSNGEPPQGEGGDPRCIPFAYNMFQDDSTQRRATLDGHGHIYAARSEQEAIGEPRRSSIDNSEVMLAKALANFKEPPTALDPKPQPARISLDSRPKPRLSFYFTEETPVGDDPTACKLPIATVGPFPEGAAEESRNPSSVVLRRKSADSTPVASKLLVDGKVPGREDKEKKIKDFRGIFKASFLRREPKVDSQESPGGSFDLKEGEQLKEVPELPSGGKEGLESIGDLSRLYGFEEDDVEKGYSFLESPKEWIKNRDRSTPRLTVELKEGPQLTRKDQRVPVDDMLRFTSLEEHGRYTIRSGVAADPINYKESMKVIGSRDVRKEEKDRVRKSVDGKNPPRLSFDAKVAASRHSVDGRPIPHQSSRTTRLSVDGRDTHYRGAGQYGDKRNANRSLESSTTSSPRRGNSRAASPRRDRDWENDLERSRWKASSVVARLMGLEDVPNFDVVPPVSSGMCPDGCRSPQRGFFTIHPEESPHPLSDEFYNLIYQADEIPDTQVQETYSQTRSWTTSHHPGRQELHLGSAPPKLKLVPFSHREPETGTHHLPASPKQQPISPKHHMVESMPQVLKHPAERKLSNEGLLYGDMDQRLRQLGLKNSIQERKTLKQILEAMHLKGLLHPPRHMDPDEKHNLSRQDQSESLTKAVPIDPQGFHPANRVKTDLFDLDYQDIPQFISAQKSKRGKQGGRQLHDGSLTPSREKNLNGEASIVVMKPINTKPASKVMIVKPSPSLPQSKDVKSMPARGSSVSREVATTPTPCTVLEKEESASTSTGISTKSETVAATVKHRPRSKSVEPRRQSRVEELPISTTQRRERIAARTAKVLSDGGEVHVWDSSKVTRSISPPVAKRSAGAKETTSARLTSPSRSAFGSSISRTADGKSRAKPTKGDEEIKSTTQVTRRIKSSRELPKGRTTVDQELAKELSRSSSGSKLVTSYVERTPSPERSNRSKSPTEVAVLRSKKTTGRTAEDLGRKEEQWESTADSYSEIQDVILDRPQNGAVMSPPFSLPRSRRSKITKQNQSGKSPSGSNVERYRQRLESEDPMRRIESESLHNRDHGRSKVSANSRRQPDELKLNPDACTPESSVTLSPREALVNKPQKVAEDDNGQLAEGSEQPSPVSVLDNIHIQEEECTPRPKSKNPGFVRLQEGSAPSHWRQNDQQKTHIAHPGDLSTPVSPIPGVTGDPLKDLIYKVARSLNMDDQESYLNKPTLEVQVPFVWNHSMALVTNSLPSSLNTREDERAYVGYIMVASGVTEGASVHSQWPTSGQIISTEIFDQLEEQLELRESARKHNVYLSGEERTEYLKEALDRRLLFDSVNYILDRKLHPYLNPQPWATGILKERPVGVPLVRAVWEEVQELQSRALDDDTLYTILQKDFTKRGEMWVRFPTEIEEIGIEIEEMIFEEMIDAAAQELTDECADKLQSTNCLGRDV